MDSSTDSELIITIAWRSAEVAALAAAGLLLLSLLVRRYYRLEARLNERVIATWRPLLTQVALDEGDPPALPRLPGRHVPYLMEEWNALQDVVRGESGARLNAVARALGFDIAARRYLHSRQVGPADPRDPHARSSARPVLVAAAPGAAGLGKRPRVVLRSGGARQPSTHSEPCPAS